MRERERNRETDEIEARKHVWRERKFKMVEGKGMNEEGERE